MGPIKKKSRLFWGATALALATLGASGCGYFSPEAKEARFMEAGRKSLAKRDYTRAIIQFRNAIRVKKDDAEAYYQLGLGYLGSGDGNMALASFWKAAELNPKHAGAQVKIAELMLSVRDQEFAAKAEEKLGSVLEKSPNDLDALNALAIAEWELGKPGDAERHLARALRLFPNDLQASVSLAQLRLTKKDFPGAEEILKKVASQQPPLANAIVALGEFYLFTNRTGEAEQQLRRAVQVDPANATALYDLANLLVRAKKVDEAERLFRQLSSLPQRQYKPVHAIFLFDSGRIQESLAEFEKLVKGSPTDRALRSMLVQAYWKANRPVDAERILARALRENPKDIEALTQRAAVYLGIANYTEAQNDLTAVLRIKPDSAEAHYLLSKVNLARDARSAQRQELAEAVRLKPDFLQARLELAQALLSANAASAALDLMRGTPPAQEKTLPAIIERNWVYLAVGDARDFVKGVDEGLALARVGDLLLQDAVRKIGMRDLAGARASLDEALNQNAKDLRALNLMVVTYRVQKDPGAVVTKLREITSKHPDSAPAQTILGDWLMASKSPAEARTAFATALKANPRYIPAAIGLAKLAASEAKLNEARDILNRAAAEAPGNRNVTFLLGNVEDLAGNRAKALELYRKVLAADPNNALALNNVAFLLADFAQQPDEALKFAQRAKEMAPDDPEIEDTLGWVLCRKGMYDIALRHLQAAAEKGSTAQREFHLATAYYKLGNRQRSEQALQLALRQDPRLPEALQLQQQLQQPAASQRK
ncbi:MAG TPA: tetratricopeptide repeat protein [Bryobacteraceae bacterium]|nr:tetratricopeptide repeat protein [Bryobacteraceae bacterium]